MAMGLDPQTLDGVLAFLGGADLVRFGGASRGANAASAARLGTLERGGWQCSQGRSLVFALSQQVVLMLAAAIDADEDDDDDDDEDRRYRTRSRSRSRQRSRLRPRDKGMNPHANLIVDHRRLLGTPLFGRGAWDYAQRIIGRAPFFGSEWWARPALLECVAVALLDSHCAFCAVHLHADEAEDVIYEYGRPHDVRHVCSACNRIQVEHHARWVKNNNVREARLRQRAWRWCTKENAECFNWHHFSQDKCDCACH